MNIRSMVLAIAVLLALAPAAAGQEAPRSPYEVTWDSPSADCHGSMPLGNGEVALNAWVEPSGDLRFYIARTDSWDDNGRLLKVGAVRVRVGEPDDGRTKKFVQTLTLKDGTLRATYGEGEARVELALWVDANRPLVCIEAETARPTPATASIELWRTKREALPSVEVSDVFARTTTTTFVEPDTLITGLRDRIGWYHRNIKSVGPALSAKIQGVADFPRQDPLLHRTFGALVATERPERVDDSTLRSSTGTRHVFAIYVHTQHPATAEQWRAEAQTGLDEALAIPPAERRAAHEAWWAEFWDRSWIHITPNGKPKTTLNEKPTGPLPANRHPVRIGMNQQGGSRFNGEFGRVGIYETVLDDAQVAALARLEAQTTHEGAGGRGRLRSPVYEGIPGKPTTLPELTSCTFAQGVTLEAWIKPAALRGDMRIVDKITPGRGDGFLFDTYPGASLRLITGAGTIQKANVLKAGRWQHVAATVTPAGEARIYLDGKPILVSNGAAATAEVRDGDDAFIVTRAYALQRFIQACAGRGRYPIKFNGSLFTVPSPGGPGDADYRRWGPGYWWQNTRLNYYPMCAAGDFEMMAPLFRMYGRDLLPLFKYKSQRYFGHGGIFVPECIEFWGDVFPDTYGWQPFEQREDKLQQSGYHKWEWVSGLELAALMLDYCEYTEDAEFLKETALPFTCEVLAFFDRHYKNGPEGRMVMHPAQALETWWDCVNPMPELAGLHAVTARMLALPEAAANRETLDFLNKLQARLPDLPTTRTAAGKITLAPAQVYKNKRNIENPELYAIFPFRLFALGRPNIEWAIEALGGRRDKGAKGWRQDDIFMAWLGQAEAAREYIVQRARSKNAGSRFPAFWGPNYDWVPDQDHGGVLLRAAQSLLLQTDGRKIYLLPAWPKDWNADFKLHAPLRTTIQAKVRDGKITELKVDPPSRQADVTVCR